MAKKDKKNNDSKIEDLEYIKKHYGEAFMQFCRKMFPTILEKKDELKSIITESFEPNRILFEDILKQGKMDEFVSFVYSKYNKKNKQLKKGQETPFELMKNAGYTLYECKNNKKVWTFKKYYNQEEALCTFKDRERIDNFYIFFAVKNNVEEIKREDYYANRRRQDDYGTSVISLQFAKPKSLERNSFLSIKNRWNHSVPNPDATFSNDLENICAGLTDSFENYLDIKLSVAEKGFELDDYVMDKKGKFYKYNNEINAYNFCGNNVVVLNSGEAVRFNPDEYLLVDYFLIDKKNCQVFDISRGRINKSILENASKKRITDLYKGYDEFHTSLGDIQKIEVEKYKDKKLDCDRIIKVTTAEGQAKIYINANNSMVKYENPYVKEIGDYFCVHTNNLKSIDLSNCKRIGSNFCYGATNLKNVNLPSNEEIGNYCCYYIQNLQNFIAPKNKKIGRCFCYRSHNLEKLNLTNNEEIGDDFCVEARKLKEFIAPKNKEIGDRFLERAGVKKVYLPKNEVIGDHCCGSATHLEEFVVPENKKIGNFLCVNGFELKRVDLSSNKEFGYNCFSNCWQMESFKTVNERLQQHIRTNISTCKIENPEERS